MLTFWNKQSYYIAKALAENLDGFIKGVLFKNTSAVFICDGRSGEGKTTISSQIGCYINRKVKEHFAKNPKWGTPPEFNLDSLAWTPDTFIDKLQNAKKGEVVIFDEAMVFSNRSTMSELNRNIVIMMSMIRSKEIFVIFNVNSIFDLDRNLPLHRADMLVHVYPREKKFASRGAYMVIPSSGGKLKRLYIQGKKFYDYSKARPAFINTFPKFFPFDDKVYEERKQEAIKDYFAEKGRYNTKAIESRDALIKYVRETTPSIRNEELARIAGVSMRTVTRAVNGR